MVPFLKFIPNFFDIFRTRSTIRDLPKYINSYSILFVDLEI